MAQWGTVISIEARRRPGGTGTPPADEIRPGPSGRAFLVGLLSFCVVAVFALLIWVHQREGERQVREMPQDARLTLYTQVLAQVQSCRDVSATTGPLRDHCTDQARFVLLFPECVGSCQRAAYDVLPHAHR
jgi:hypothetical protein